MDQILLLITDNSFSTVQNYFVTLFGAIVMYALSINKGISGSIEFQRKMFPGHSELFYDRLDFLFMVTAGSVIGTIFFSPSTTHHALAAGFGWVGALRILTSTSHGGRGRG